MVTCNIYFLLLFVSCNNPVSPDVSVNTDPQVNIQITSISIDQGDINMNVSDKRKLTATIKPLNANDQSITWESSNSAIASINQYGYIIANKVGKVTISVRTQNNKSDNCIVNIIEPIESPLSVNGLQLIVGTSSVDTINFNSNSTCTIPNYRLPNNYYWKDRPSYTYNRISNKSATLIITYTYWAHQTSVSYYFQLIRYYKYTYNLTFVTKTSGTYKLTRYHKSTDDKNGDITIEDETDTRTGTFTLS
jgi:hypothetical protein